MPPYLELKEAFGSRFYYEPYNFQASAISYLSLGNFSFTYPWLNFSHSEANLGIGFLALVLSLLAFKTILFCKTIPRWLALLTSLALLLLLISTEISLDYNLVKIFLSFIAGWGMLLSIVITAFFYYKKTRYLNLSFFSNQEILFLHYSALIFSYCYLLALLLCLLVIVLTHFIFFIISCLV